MADQIVGRLRLLGLPDLSCVTNGQEYAEALVKKLVIESLTPEADACNKASVSQGSPVVCSDGTITTLSSFADGDVLTVTDFSNGIVSFQPLDLCADYQYKNKIEQATLAVANHDFLNGSSGYTSASSTLSITNTSTCRDMSVFLNIDAYIKGEILLGNIDPFQLKFSLEYSLNGGPYSTWVEQMNYYWTATDGSTLQDVQLGKGSFLLTAAPGVVTTVDIRLVGQSTGQAGSGSEFDMTSSFIQHVLTGLSV